MPLALIPVDPPIYHLHRVVCKACGTPTGLVLSKACYRLDHEIVAAPLQDLHCDDEMLWPCSSECAQQLVDEAGGVMVVGPLTSGYAERGPRSTMVTIDEKDKDEDKED